MVAACLVLLPACGVELTESELDGLLAGAWRSYSTGDWDIAVENFRRVAQADVATDRQRFSAMLGLATTLQWRPDPDLPAAAGYYERLQELPVEGAGPLGLLGEAQIRRRTGRREEALETLLRLRTEYPESPEADESVIHTAQIYFSAEPDPKSVGGFAVPPPERTRKGMEVLRDWLERRPENPLAAVMHMMLGARHVGKGEHEEAVEQFRAALESGIESARTRSTLRWQVARLAEKELKDYELAEEYYGRFVEESKRHVLYHRATESLERLRRLRADGGGAA